jgi:hypothetical protein
VTLSRIFTSHKFHSDPRPCEHHSINATTLPLTGRCMECGALVATPFTLSSKGH